MQLMASGKCVGALLINIDHETQGEHRAFIRHLTAVSEEIFPSILRKALEFIWENLDVDSVKLLVHHYVDATTEKGKAGQMAENKWLKDQLSMARKGFKWKSLVNQDGLRYTVMQMARPKELPKVSRLEPVVVKAATIYGLASMPGRTRDTLYEAAVPGNLHSALLSLKEQGGLAGSTEASVQEIAKLPEGFAIPGAKTTTGTNMADVQVDISAAELSLDTTSIAKADQYVCSVLSMALRLPAFAVERTSGKTVLRIAQTDKEDLMPLCLVDKERVALVIIPLIQQRFSLYLIPADRIDNGKALAPQVRELSSDIDENKIVRLDELVLPSFAIEASGCDQTPLSLGTNQLQALAQKVQVSLNARETDFALRQVTNLGSVGIDQPLT
jgi:hypothetical protein